MFQENQKRFLEIIDQIAASYSLDTLNQLIKDMRSSYNLENIVYHAVYVPEVELAHPLLLLTYDPAWVERYKLQNYFQIDPVVTSGIKSFLPIDWSTVDRESRSAKTFFLDAERYSVGRQGVTLPIRGPGGERALFTITSNAWDSEWRHSRFYYMKEFQLIAHYFHERAIGISGYRNPERNRSLSRRERECIQLTARGMVPKQIGGVLGITDGAVRLHLRSSCHKLGCASTEQAIAKLVLFEQIQP